MHETGPQQDKWETYWSETRSIANSSYPEARSIWDSDVEAGVDLDIPRFKDHFDPELPVLDVGCGCGQQTARLAHAFRRVIGTDVSASAVAFAAQAHPASNLSYDVLDALNAQDVARLHATLGDVNLYVRTVVHIFGPSDRKVLAASLARLMGERGVLYNIELGPKSPEYFENWIQTYGMPKKLARVMSKGLRPGPVSRSDIDAMFPAREFEVLADGDAVWPGVKMLSEKLEAEGRSEGALFEPPMYYSIVRRRERSAS